MEKVISELPPSAYVIFVISLAVIYAVQRFGLWQGEKGSSVQAEKAQVAAVIVDPSALNKASAAGEALAESVRHLGKLTDDHTHMLCRRIEALTDAVEAQTTVINSLILELARRAAK